MSGVHPGLPVRGYAPQSDAAVRRVNRLKELEERVLREIDAMDNHNLAEGETIDHRWQAIARTDIQKGFMAAARAVFQPQRIALPEDAA